MRYSTAGKILVVDDESQNVEVLRRLMTRLGYDVLTAADGESAVTEIDLIITDWNMPGMSGLEFIRTLRGQDATKAIPVTHGDEQWHRGGSQGGAESGRLRLRGETLHR